MINTNEHSIQKVFVEVNTKSKKVAEGYKNSIENFLQEEVFPEIEKYFNSLELGSEEMIQQVSKLSLEVTISNTNKSLNFKSTKEEIREQILAKLESVLHKPEAHDVVINSVSVSKNKTNTFFYFLENGTLPWWNNMQKEVEFSKKILFEITESKNFETRFLSAIQNVKIKQRLINQFFDEELHLLFLGVLNKPKGFKEVLSGISIASIKSEEKRRDIWFYLIEGLLQKDFSGVIKKLEKKVTDLAEKGLLKQSISDETKQKSSNKLIPINKEAFVEKNKLEYILRFFYSVLPGFNSSSKNSIPDFNNIIKEEKKEIHLQKGKDKRGAEIVSFEKGGENNVVLEEEKLKENREEAFKIGLNKGVNKFKKEIDKRAGNNSKYKENINDELKNQFLNDFKKENGLEFNEQIELLNTKIVENKIEDVSETRSYLVNNAGLILLHPFLKHFFNSCGFLNKENKLIKPIQAVHLLHYVATKKEQQLESNLIFEKFLCNLPIKHSIPRNIKLSEELKEKSEELLKGVVQNWEILKKSSPDLIRNEFIQRSGKLDLTKENPNITIERKTQDIFLDKLPWNISMCKLPWMKSFIITDW